MKKSKMLAITVVAIFVGIVAFLSILTLNHNNIPPELLAMQQHSIFSTMELAEVQSNLEANLLLGETNLGEVEAYVENQGIEWCAQDYDILICRTSAPEPPNRSSVSNLFETWMYEMTFEFIDDHLTNIDVEKIISSF